MPSDGGGDLFAHYTAIQMDGYKTLKAGQQVVFDVEEGPKGHHAVNIRADDDDIRADDDDIRADDDDTRADDDDTRADDDDTRAE